MPKGKKVRKPPQHGRILIKPSVVILGHSMPRRLRDFFDNELMTPSISHEVANGWATLGQIYSRFLGVDNLYHEVHFIHCPTVLSPYFFQRVLAAGHLHPEMVIINIASNDLAAESVSEQGIATALLGLIQYLCDQYGVKRVVFISELKRCDTPNGNGVGRLFCSPEIFRTRVLNYNYIILNACENHPIFNFVWLPGFWNDNYGHEPEVWEWSSDRVHPGPNFYTVGFQRYFDGMRQILLGQYHSLAALLH